MEWILAITGILITIYIWLSVIVSIALVRTDDLERLQKIAQTTFIWLVPYIGSAFVLR
jgi:hypothetical protein